MAEQTDDEREPKRPVLPALLFFIMTIAILAAIGGVAYGFYTGWLTPYWVNLSDAHASIISQLIFFAAAAWAAVAVPFLFGGQLRTMEAAAKRAEQTSKNVEAQMKQAAIASEEQFKSIMRLQLMSLGHLVDPKQLEMFQTPEERKEFVRSAWKSARDKLESVISRENGHRQNALDNIHRYSIVWWDKLNEFGTVRDCFAEFRLVHAKSKKQSFELPELKEVNEASIRIQNFEASPVTNETPRAADQAAPPSQPLTIRPIENGSSSPQPLQ